MKHPTKLNVMSKRMLNALKKAIEKWQEIVDGTGIDRGTENCALCNLYYGPDKYNNSCQSCPVHKKTGDIWCSETPYEIWNDHQENDHEDIEAWKIHCDQCKVLAQKELKFLKSLLPKV